MESAPVPCLKAELALLQNSSAWVGAIDSKRTETHRRNSLDLAEVLNVMQVCL